MAAATFSIVRNFIMSDLNDTSRRVTPSVLIDVLAVLLIKELAELAVEELAELAVELAVEKLAELAVELALKA